MSYLFGKHKDWECVIGLEIHAQVQSQAKLFSGSSTKPNAEQNTHVSLFDAAIPGTLPILNMFCMEQAIKTGLAINGKINHYSVFDRKHYFYPDLPNGYQISQFFHPIITGGEIFIELEDEGKQIQKTINLERIHVEQDAGKSVHDLDKGGKVSHIDLNRSGVALMEIVSKPEINSPQEAVAYIKKLQLIMQYIGSCDGNMELGNLRCDANVSVRRCGDKKLGTRCEIKNLNSTSNIEEAIKYEIQRQIDILESGGIVECQTRLYDVDSCETKKLRGKEEAEDYRYFPDNDLLPVEFSDEDIERIRKTLPKLPDERKKEYVAHGLNSEVISNLVNDCDMGDYFDAVISCGIKPEFAINWINVELSSRMNKAKICSFKNLPLSVQVENLVELLKLIEDSTINGKIAKDVLDKMFDSGLDDSIPNLTAKQIIERDGLSQVTDVSAIEKIIDNILESNKPNVEKYKAGSGNLLGFFVGQVMKQSGGKANPKIVNEILLEKLK
jgi:aspartyl-tRNA(Asn)/glutamyl-tRNA(Gln) amidotransferase subunit B